MKYLQLYKNGLPYAMASSVGISYFIGIVNIKSEVFYPKDQMMNVLGIMSIGAFVGLSYPVSMPLLAGRYLYRNRI